MFVSFTRSHRTRLRASLQEPGEVAPGTGPGASPDPNPAPLKERHVTGNRQVVQRIGGYGCRSLEEDQQVEYEVTQGPKGPQAARVRVA